MASFYVDEDISPQLVADLRARGHDGLATIHAARSGATDSSQLLFAVQTQRILIVFNTQDFMLLHQAWLDWAPALAPSPVPSHPGILAMTARPTHELVSALESFLANSPSLRNELYRWKYQTNAWNIRRGKQWVAYP